MGGGETVLVTGASTGLGLAIVRELVAARYQVIATARQTSLPRFADAGVFEGQRLWIRALDVLDADQRSAVVEEVQRRLGGVDILINNAGVAYRSVVEHVREEDRLAQMHINYRAPMELARLVLPGMRNRGHGRIINVSSVGGMMAMPTMAVYSASKFALEGASEALYYEVRPWNIHVSLIQPGFINSDGFAKVRFTPLSRAGVDAATDPYYAHYRHMSGFIERVMRMVPATPQKVARTVMRTLKSRRPPLRVPATFDARLFAWLRRFLPRRLYHALLYRSLPTIKRWGPAASLAPPQGIASTHDVPGNRGPMALDDQ